MTPALALTAAIAMALVVFRAATQAITIDEAATYILFVYNPEPGHWVGSTNNHVLNTMLMRLTTRLFGSTELTARLPALLGAAIYISACYRFCKRIGGGLLLQWASLVCLTFSPFIMDYLVAARGYSLALGFLMTALLADPKTIRGCILASTAIGLCFASNFSFAFACAAVLSGLFLWSWRERTIPRAKLLAAYALPPILVNIVISAPSILTFPRDELWYGAHSLREAFASVLESQLAHRTPLLYAIPGAISLAWLIHIRKQLAPLAILFGGAFLATAALHAIAHNTLGLLYPLDRTGVFFIPLAFGAIAAAAAIPGGWLRWAQIAALLFVAVMNFASLRIDRFEEWNFNQDTDKLYSVLTCMHQLHGVNSIASGWSSLGPLNFYRYSDPGTTFPVVADESVSAPDTQAFSLDARLQPTVVAARDLIVVWKSRMTEAFIAVPRTQLQRYQASTCFGL